MSPEMSELLLQLYLLQAGVVFVIAWMDDNDQGKRGVTCFAVRGVASLFWLPFSLGKAVVFILWHL